MVYKLYTFTCRNIDIKKVDNQLIHVVHVKDRYTNYTFIDKLTKWHQ